MKKKKLNGLNLYERAHFDLQKSKGIEPLPGEVKYNVFLCNRFHWYNKDSSIIFTTKAMLCGSSVKQ